MRYIYQFEISKMSQGIQKSKNMWYKFSNYHRIIFCKKEGEKS